MCCTLYSAEESLFFSPPPDRRRPTAAQPVYLKTASVCWLLGVDNGGKKKKSIYIRTTTIGYYTPTPKDKYNYFKILIVKKKKKIFLSGYKYTLAKSILSFFPVDLPTSHRAQLFSESFKYFIRNVFFAALLFKYFFLFLLKIFLFNNYRRSMYSYEQIK